jgi:hypothetical protein
MTNLEKELQEQLTKLANEMKCIGNGYGWTVQNAMEVVLPILERNIPGFNAANVVVDCEDFS